MKTKKFLVEKESYKTTKTRYSNDVIFAVPVAVGSTIFITSAIWTIKLENIINVPITIMFTFFLSIAVPAVMYIILILSQDKDKKVLELKEIK